MAYRWCFLEIKKWYYFDFQKIKKILPRIAIHSRIEGNKPYETEKNNQKSTLLHINSYNYVKI